MKKQIIKITALMLMMVFVAASAEASRTVNKASALVSPLATLEFDPTSHDFGEKLPGETDSTVFYIWRGGGCCSLDYTLASDVSWITVNPTSGTSNGEQDPITVTIDTTGLASGQHTGHVNIDSTGGSGVFTVTVFINGGNGPALVIDSIKGGMGISVVIHNIGTADAENIVWTMDVTGGLFISPRKKSGNIASLTPTATRKIIVMLCGLGLGNIQKLPTITFTVSANGLDPLQKVVQAKVFFTYVFQIHPSP